MPLPAFLSDADGSKRWKKPGPNAVKINVDAALFPSSHCFSFARLVRDSSGRVIEAFSRCLAGDISPVLAEALGVKEALSWIKRKAWSNVTIETDCLEVVQSLRSKIFPDSYYGAIIGDCLEIWSSLLSVDILYVMRSANLGAHTLARASSFIADRSLQMDELSSDLLCILQKDCY